MEENKETIIAAETPAPKIKKTTGIVYIILICIFTLAIIGDMIIFAVVPSNNDFGGGIDGNMGGRGNMFDTSDTAMMNPNGGMDTDFDGEMPDTDFGGDMSMPEGEAPDGAGGDMSMPEGEMPDTDFGGDMGNRENIDTDFAEMTDTDFEKMRGNMNGGMGGGQGGTNSVLRTIRRCWLPILIVCAVGDVVCVILYILARKRAHKKPEAQYTQPAQSEPIAENGTQDNNPSEKSEDD